jgi:hypothetical protein
LQDQESCRDIACIRDEPPRGERHAAVRHQRVEAAEQAELDRACT